VDVEQLDELCEDIFVRPMNQYDMATKKWGLVLKLKL